MSRVGLTLLLAGLLLSGLLAPLAAEGRTGGVGLPHCHRGYVLKHGKCVCGHQMGGVAAANREARP